MTFKECIDLGYSINECNAITEPKPSILIIALAIAVIIIIATKAYKEYNQQ